MVDFQQTIANRWSRRNWMKRRGPSTPARVVATRDCDDFAVTHTNTTGRRRRRGCRTRPDHSHYKRGHFVLSGQTIRPTFVAGRSNESCRRRHDPTNEEMLSATATRAVKSRSSSDPMRLCGSKYGGMPCSFGFGYQFR
jgi:hypothetical protein